VLVGLLEVDLAADRRHADRVAVVPDAPHRALEQVARRGGVRGSPKRRESRIATGGRRPRRRRAGCRRRRSPRPGRLDRAGVVWDSTLNAHASPSPDRHRARVLARVPSRRAAPRSAACAAACASACSPQCSDHMRLKTRAPHRWARARAGDDQLYSWSVSRSSGGGPLDLHAAPGGGEQQLEPSSEPVRGSTACSGWGISPSTLPAGGCIAGDVAGGALKFLARGVAQRTIWRWLQLVEHGIGRPVATVSCASRDRESLAARAGRGPRRGRR
jgi:hypothetical protein